MKLTFPGMKQQEFASMYFVYVIDNIDIRVSMHVKMSECFARGWFLQRTQAETRNNQKTISLFFRANFQALFTFVLIHVVAIAI